MAGSGSATAAPVVGGGSARPGREEPPPPRAGPGRRLVARGTVTGLLVAALVVALRGTGLLSGFVGLAAAAVLVLAVPTSRLVSRRLLINGLCVLGWLPLLWWWPVPTGGLGRVTVVLAAGAGALAGWAAAGRRPRSRWRALVPRVAVVDAVPAAAGLAAVFMLAPWIRLREGTSALTVMMNGWDHSAHYFMTAMVHQQGVVQWRAAPPQVGSWSFVHYPEGFHTIAAATMELLRPGTPGAPGDELALYGRAVGLLSAGMVVVVVAGLAALPALRRRPLVAAVAGAAVSAGLLWGPGGMVLADGFPNFSFGIALLAGVPLVASTVPRWPAPVPMLALGGALVGIAHSWALLLTMAVPAACVVLVPLVRRRARAPRAWWVLTAVIALATLAGTLVAVAVIRFQSVEAILVYGGGVTSRGVAEVATVVGLAVVACLMAGWSLARARSDELARTAGLALGPVVGGLTAAWIATVQLRSGGLGYYFWKYAIALEILALVVAGAAFGTLVARAPAIADSRRRVVGLACCVFVLVAAAFGPPDPRVPGAGAFAGSAGMAARARAAVASDNPEAAAARILAAAAVSRTLDRPTVYLPVATQSTHDAASIGQWHAALSGGWTDALNAPIGLLLGNGLSPEAAPVVAQKVLTASPEVDVVVPPDAVEGVRSALDPVLAGRVHSW